MRSCKDASPMRCATEFAAATDEPRRDDEAGNLWEATYARLTDRPADYSGLFRQCGEAITRKTVPLVNDTFWV